MTSIRNSSAVFTFTLTEEEREQLLNWLEQRLRNKHVEEHRTATAEFRKLVLHQEKILESLINKLRSC
jgi:hypothetical protein